MKTNASNRYQLNARFRAPARWVGATAVSALGLFALAGCTSGSAPIVTETPPPTVSAAPSASPSPSATPLTDAELLALMPPDAAYPDVRGAIATAEFFLAQYAPVLETGDLTVWDALSMPDCVFCESVRGHVETNSVAGNYETGGALTLDPNTVIANYYAVDGFTYVTFDYVQGPSIVHHSDGSIGEIDAGEIGQVSLRMTLDSTTWRVSDAEAQPE